MTARFSSCGTLVACLLLTSPVAAFSFFFFPAKNFDWDEDISLISLMDSNSTTSMINNHPSDHDSLIPIQMEDIIGFLFAVFGLILAAGGGIGGGGILVPIYILILGFLPKHAIPLSNVTVFGGAVAGTLRNSRRRHPSADRPLIDWDLILVMEPPTLAGALIGANLNKMLPETAIAVMLVLLLSFTAYNTLKKARKMYQKETEDMKCQHLLPADKLYEDDSMNEYLLTNENFPPIEEDGFPGGGDFAGMSMHGVDANQLPLTLQSVFSSGGDLHHEDESFVDDSSNEESHNLVHNTSREAILEEERHPNRRNILLVVVLFVVVLLVNILKGGGGFKSPLGIECGSNAFWMAQAFLLIWILFISWLGRRFLLKDEARKAEAGYIYLDEDLKWDRKSTVIYPLISTLAGFCAGMFGIGGGIIKGPLMLAMGIHPAVASATSACMIFFTSFTATTTFSVYGLMVTDYAIVGAFLGFFATLLGQTLMSRILAKSQRNSYIAFSIGFVVLLSAMLMTMESLLRIVSRQNQDEANEEFGGICDSHLNGHHT
ncbi:hypothetical protein ACHAWF_008690 [Thalassiosira exigua]